MNPKDPQKLFMGQTEAGIWLSIPASMESKNINCPILTYFFCKKGTSSIPNVSNNERKTNPNLLVLHC